MGSDQIKPNVDKRQLNNITIEEQKSSKEKQVQRRLKIKSKVNLLEAKTNALDNQIKKQQAQVNFLKQKVREYLAKEQRANAQKYSEVIAKIRNRTKKIQSRRKELDTRKHQLEAYLLDKHSIDIFNTNEDLIQQVDPCLQANQFVKESQNQINQRMEDLGEEDKEELKGAQDILKEIECEEKAKLAKKKSMKESQTQQASPSKKKEIKQDDIDNLIAEI